MNKNLKNTIIAIIIAVAGFFGYKIIIEPPINVVSTTQIKSDTIKVDSVKVITDTTE